MVSQKKAMDPQTPLMPFFHALVEKLETENEEVPREIINTILQLNPQSIEHPLDGEQALNLLNFLVDATHAKAVPPWSDQLLTRFPTESGIFSMVAVLLNTLRELANSDGQPTSITPEAIKNLFVKSMDIDPECGRSFSRAGLQFLSENNFGEAERCLARAFPLEQAISHLRFGLADVYANTERPRDALAVLDMALREGCEEPRLAWHAAMHASALDQFQCDADISQLVWRARAGAKMVEPFPRDRFDRIESSR